MNKTDLLAALIPIDTFSRALAQAKRAQTPEHLAYARVPVDLIDRLARLYREIVALPDDALAAELRRRAPVQGYAGGIPWSVHLRAYDAYAARYGTAQSAARLAERGGFGVGEMDMFLPGWRDEVSALTAARARADAAEARLAELEARGGLVERVSSSLETASTGDIAEVLVVLNSLSTDAARELHSRTDRSLSATSRELPESPESSAPR